jgi:hypothetical protein
MFRKPSQAMAIFNYYLIQQPKHALNKIHSRASMKCEYVAATGCHHQGFIQSKEVQAEHANLGIVSPLLE